MPNDHIKNKLRSLLDACDSVINAPYEPNQYGDRRSFRIHYSQLTERYQSAYRKANSAYESAKAWTEEMSLRQKKLEHIRRSDSIQHIYYKTNGVCDLLTRLIRHYREADVLGGITPGVVYSLLELMSFELEKLEQLQSATAEESRKPTVPGYCPFSGEIVAIRDLLKQYQDSPLLEQEQILTHLEPMIRDFETQAENNLRAVQSLSPVTIPQPDTQSSDELMARMLALYHLFGLDCLTPQDQPDPEPTDLLGRQIMTYAQDELLTRWPPLRQ